MLNKLVELDIKVAKWQNVVFDGSFYDMIKYVSLRWGIFTTILIAIYSIPT